MEEQLHLDQFVRDHGGNPIPCGVGRMLLPDGARLKLNGPLYELPPKDHLQCCRLPLSYAKVRLDLAITATEHFYGVCTHGGASFSWDEKVLGPAPAAWRQVTSATRKDWDAENTIKARLAEIVAERKQAVTAASAELASINVPVPI